MEEQINSFTEVDWIFYMNKNANKIAELLPWLLEMCHILLNE